MTGPYDFSRSVTVFTDAFYVGGEGTIINPVLDIRSRQDCGTKSDDAGNSDLVTDLDLP